MSTTFHFPDYLVAAEVAAALAEDLSHTPDWSAGLINPATQATAHLKTNQDLVVCGSQWFTQAFKLCDPNCQLEWLVAEGQHVMAGQQLCRIYGQAQAMLTAERSGLNFMQLLSATASLTARFVTAIEGSNTLIMDTRKTIPGLRLAQKYAVRVGGGNNQRLGLYDGVLIKENHILAHGGIGAVLAHAFATIPAHIPIQIEVESYLELQQAVAAGARLILLDNMNLAEIVSCIEYCRDRHVVLEVSGNINLNNVAAYANLGVDRISIGALTKHIQAIDLSLRFIR